MQWFPVKVIDERIEILNEAFAGPHWRGIDFKSIGGLFSSTTFQVALFYQNKELLKFEQLFFALFLVLVGHAFAFERWMVEEIKGEEKTVRHVIIKLRFLFIICSRRRSSIRKIN